MGGDGVGIVGVRRVLDRAEILHALVRRHHHQPPRMLPGGPPDPHAAQGQPVFLRPAHGHLVFLQILFHKAVGGFLRQRPDGPRPEHLGFAEHLNGVAVGPGLILAGEVQVDIRHLAAAKAQEGFEGNVEAVLFILGPAFRARLVRHVRAAAIGPVLDEFAVFALRAAVVGRQGVDLRDAGHIGRQRRAHGAPGAHQIAVFQGTLDQFLCGHVDHVVFSQNAAQLHVQPVHDELGRVFAVKAVDLFPDQAVQVLLGVLQLGREQLLGQQLELLDLVRHQAGIGHHHLIGFFLPQVGELLQHLIGGFEIDGQGLVGVGELFRGQEDVPEHLVLRLPEMHVAGGADGLP